MLFAALHQSAMQLLAWTRCEQDKNCNSLSVCARIVVGDCGPGDGFQSPGISDRLQANSSVDLTRVADVVGFHYPVSIKPVAVEPGTAGGDLAFYEELWTLPGHQKLWASEE